VEEKKKGEEENKIGRQFSAGGLVFKPQTSKGKKSPLWLLAKSNPSEEFPKEVWRFPKGWIDDDEGGRPGPITRGERKVDEVQLQKAAKREVEEEGGVEADIVKKIGTEKYFVTIGKERLLKFVTFYLMKWKRDLPGGFGFETSQVAWLPYEKARKRLSYSGEKKILDRAIKSLREGIQKNLI
jgi:8-oxo-dGTP pyrophosphatase MutT (NUDIX family)